jgi:hypothetical protein
MTYEITYTKTKTTPNQIRILASDGTYSLACYFTEDQIKNERDRVMRDIKYITDQLRKFHEIGKRQ